MSVTVRRALLAGLAVCAVMAGSAVPPAGAHRESALVPVSESDAPSLLDDGDPASLRHAIQQSLAWLSRQSPGQGATGAPGIATGAEQIRGLRRMLDLLADDPPAAVLGARVRAEFDLFTSAGRDGGAMLVTGYHEPIVDAAEAPGGAYRVPILGVPRDLAAARRGSYWTRAEIEEGRLGSAARPLAWARDRLDVFFMEIEGSGTLRFPGGRELRVGYAATNARPYRSIGWLLIQEGRIAREAMSMRALREWLAAYPAERTRVLRHNESYVFFRVLPGAPVGSLGVPLTPGRSIATDARVFPRAALAFIRTVRPVQMPDGSIGWRPVARFVLSQDAGGVIRGPGRVDIFWGRGPEAELAASEMKEPGDLYVVLPRAKTAETLEGQLPRCCAADTTSLRR
jgi:membrane-bound lytic murein transglycosylase A